MTDLVKITVSATVAAPREKAWEYYTNPEHIIKWNFADDSWWCPRATNDIRVGGRYYARMEAKDGSAGFDFEAVYTEVVAPESFTYEFGGRYATVTFVEQNGLTMVTVVFDPETENPRDLQQAGWQSILNNYAAVVEKSV